MEAIKQQRGFWMRENCLSDASYTYDIMFNDEEVYNALSELDAHDTMVKLRGTIGMIHMKQCADRRWIQKPLYQRLNMMSHRFAYNSPEASTLAEAAELAQSKAAA